MMGWITGRDPDTDGAYLVTLGYGDKRTDKMDFTVDFGWNTGVLSDGTIHSDAAISNEDGYISAWMPMPEPYKEVKA